MSQIDDSALRQAAALLAQRDPHLKAVHEAFGPPPLWARPPGFATLVYIILEQQVSLASARAAYQRLGEALGVITPQAFLKLDDAELKRIGFSRQKTGYGRGLAHALLDGTLDLDALADLPDDSVRTALIQVKGIGRWTADIYLMEALLRPDVWPTGDLALAIAVRRVKGMEGVPKPRELEEIGRQYTPWRSVAARMFWWHYLGGVMPGG